MAEIGISIENGKGSTKTDNNSLHEAARKYDFNLLWYLLETGCDINAKDGNGRSALHVLLKDEFLGHLNEQKMQQCLQVLIEYRCDVNAREGTDSKGDCKGQFKGECPLSLAVLNKFESSALLLVRNGADTTVKTPKFQQAHSLASTIALTMPEVMMEILDSGVIVDYNDINGERGEPLVKLDWRLSEEYPIDENQKQLESEKTKKIRATKHLQRESSFLYSLLDAPPTIRNEYLTHPLVSAFLHLRIKKTRRSLSFFQLIMSLYPLCYMAFVYFLYFDRCKFERPKESDGTTTAAPSGKQCCEISTGIMIAAYLCSMVVIGSGLLEIYMLLRVDYKYIKSWRAWVLRASIVTMGFTLWPALQFDTLTGISWQYPIAALGTFFAWIMFLLQIELIPHVKIYLEMLAAIILSVLKIILLFLPLFIGFYMGFNLMFFKIGGIMNFIMMTVDVGSNEYEDMMESTKDAKGWFTVMASIFSVAFIIVIAIVFMNFLLGASISDIQELKRDATIMSLSHRVQTVFVINLLFPFRYNVVSQEDIEKGKLYFTYVPNGERSHSLKEKIRTRITLLLKSKYSPTEVDDADDNTKEQSHSKFNVSKC